MKKKLGIYCRISGDKKNKNDYSINTQKEAGIKLATDNGWEYELYIDEGKSGTLYKGRMMDLISDMKNKKLHSIFSYDQSRLEREPHLWSMIVGESINNEVSIYFKEGLQDLRNEHNLFLSKLISLVNNFYTRITSAKLKTTYREKMLKGKTHGKLPYGITRDKDNNYIINETELPIVQEVFRLAKIGYGTLKIAKFLNENGYKNRQGTVWQNSTISGILTNTIYIGMKNTISNADEKDEKIIVKLPFKIIDEKVFTNVNQRIKSLEQKIKKSKYLYLLNELIICPYCGRLVTGRYREKSRAYKCINFHPHLYELQCKDAFGINLPKLDTFILHLLFKTKLLDYTVVESLKSNKELDKLKEELQYTLKHLTSNKKAFNNAYELYNRLLSDEINNDDLYKKIKEYSKKGEELESNKLRIQNEIDYLKNNTRLKTIADATEYFKSNYEFSKLSEYVHSIIEKIKIYRSDDKKEYIITIKLYSFDIDLAFKTNKMLMNFEMLSFKDTDKKHYFEDLFKNSFDSYFRGKVDELLNAQNSLTKTNSPTTKKLEDLNGSGDDYDDDMNLFKEIIKDEFFDNVYKDLSVTLSRDELIHFNNPIYKKPTTLIA